MLALNLQDDANRIVAKLPRAHRRVPAYDQLVALLPSRRLVIGCEPVPFDEIAARSDWLLLILGGKIDRAHGMLEVLQGPSWFSFGMQQLTNFAVMVPFRP